MLTLFSYPELYGVADNNPYGLKVFAFLRLCGLTFRHEHIVDAKAAPRGQLPYITDDGVAIGDSDAIIQYLVSRYNVDIDSGLTATERRIDLLVRRTLGAPFLFSRRHEHFVALTSGSPRSGWLERQQAISIAPASTRARHRATAFCGQAKALKERRALHS
jgi:glutathione S-transferase